MQSSFDGALGKEITVRFKFTYKEKRSLWSAFKNSGFYLLIVQISAIGAKLYSKCSQMSGPRTKIILASTSKYEDSEDRD
jgi:hypothetical protein